jgi:hypothetical protein
MFPTIGAALEEAKSDSEIHVYSGIYKESLVITKPIAIVGKGDPAEIIIEATNASCLAMEAETGTIQNLTLRSLKKAAEKKHPAVWVTHGRPKLINCSISAQFGSCVIVEGPGSSPTLTGCKLMNGFDAGIYIHTHSFCHLEKCDITKNKVGVFADKNGAFDLRGGTVTINGVVGILVNKAAEKECNLEGVEVSSNGVGLQVRDGSKATLRNCVIKQNQLAGVSVTEQGLCHLYKCRILENNQCGVVVGNTGSKVILEDSWVIGNKSLLVNGERLAAVSIGDGAVAEINSCEFYDNEGAPWNQPVPPAQVILKGINKTEKP